MDENATKEVRRLKQNIGIVRDSIEEINENTKNKKRLCDLLRQKESAMSNIEESIAYGEYEIGDDVPLQTIVSANSEVEDMIIRIYNKTGIIPDRIVERIPQSGNNKEKGVNIENKIVQRNDKNDTDDDSIGMKVTAETQIRDIIIPLSSAVGRELDSIIEGATTAYPSNNIYVVANIQEWEWNIPENHGIKGDTSSPPPDDFQMKLVKRGNGKIQFENLPDFYTEYAASIDRLVLSIKQVIDRTNNIKYVFDDSGSLIPKKEYESDERDNINISEKNIHMEDFVMNRSQVGTSDTPEQNFCTGCGEAIDDNEAAFCPYCGTEL